MATAHITDCATLLAAFEAQTTSQHDWSPPDAALRALGVEEGSPALVGRKIQFADLARTMRARTMQVEQPVMGTDVDVVARNPRHWVDFCADADHCADALVQALKRRLPTEAGDAQDGARFAVDVVGLLLQQAPLEAVLRKLDDSISFWQLRASCGRSGAVAFRDKVWTADVVPKDRQAAVAAAHAAGRGAKSGHGGGRAGQAYGGGNGGGQAAQPYAPGNGGGRGRGGGGHWRGGQRK